MSYGDPTTPDAYGGPGAIGEIGPGKGAIDHDVRSGVPNCQPIPSKPRSWFETFVIYTYTRGGWDLGAGFKFFLVKPQFGETIQLD